MKWWPGECVPGDMIRVHLGSIWHYGIFVSEDEIIQFGLPPIAQYRLPDDQVKVCVSDVDVFSCGQIIEVARPDRQEQRHKNSAEKVVEIARSRVGEGGYSLIHNNCEHFANECYFGVKRSEQQESVLRKWTSRPILDVYICGIPEDAPMPEIICGERARQLEATRLMPVRLQRAYAWNTLEYAVSRSFNLNPGDIDFKCSEDGAWSCDKFFFSISHTDGVAVVAVSNAPVGVDVENTGRFMKKLGEDGGMLARMMAESMTWRERRHYGEGIDDFLICWTRKESLFKAEDKKRFVPKKLDTTGHSFATKIVAPAGSRYYISVCADNPASCHYYSYDGRIAHAMGQQELEEVTK